MCDTHRPLIKTLLNIFNMLCYRYMVLYGSAGHLSHC